MENSDSSLDCIILSDENHIATLATIKSFNTGMTLYYIPVRPLWHWMQCSESQRLAELIICIFAYLEQVVKVPFFTEDYSYLAGQYEMIEQWVNDEQEDEPYRQKQLDELYIMHNAGLKIHAQISNPDWLGKFENIVQNFHPKDNWEQDWALLATNFFQLYQQYPERTIFDRIHSDLRGSEEDERIYPDQYISFYWSGSDCFKDCLFDMIDNHFQEIAYIDEPMQIQLFNAIPENTTPDFDFETRLFDLINRLSTLLNDYDYEERDTAI